MGMKKYFFDSYAIIELMSGNPSYARFINEPVIITVFNLTEIYYSVLNSLDESSSEEVYDRYSRCVAKIPDSVLKKAMKFKKENKKKNLSYSDCIGYTYALENELVFLTGDKEFESLSHVEFVK
jgi:uncharacterized protein